MTNDTIFFISCASFETTSPFSEMYYSRLLIAKYPSDYHNDANNYS